VTSAEIERAADVVRRGGVVAAATDTLVGLLALALRADAVARVVSAKGPGRTAPIPVLCADAEQAFALARDVPPAARELAETGWPGPLTLVVAARPGLVPDAVTAGLGTVGVRVPGPSPALDLVRAVGAPLTGTSANLAGRSPPASTDDLDPAVAAAVDMILPGRCTLARPSTVIDVTGPEPRVVRQGAG
jgi:L-threonylcarbamoyladenylate synthase